METGIINKSIFDFDDVHITKSPCRDCPHSRNLPGCSNNCQKLSQLQSLLVGIISCSKDVSEWEEYALSI